MVWQCKLVQSTLGAKENMRNQSLTTILSIHLLLSFLSRNKFSIWPSVVLMLLLLIAKGKFSLGVTAHLDVLALEIINVE